MTNYFENVKTKDEIKSKYKELVKKYHPDIYGIEGNEILKEIHNQLERVLKKADNEYFKQDEDIKDTDEIIILKKNLVQESLKYVFPEGALFALYWENGLKPCNHKNPLSKRQFSGWNVWSLEISMLVNDFKYSDWSTFAQYRDAKNFVDKGQKGTRLTLAVHNKEKDENGEEIEQLKFYKGYTVFNYAQTKAVASTDQNKKLTTKDKLKLSLAS